MQHSNDGWIGNWSPGIGDPTLDGWLLVALYALTAVLCWRVVRGVRWERRNRAEHRLWQALCALLLALGINKQLDLQTALWELGRGLAHAQGWYDQKRLVQLALVLLIAAGGVLVGLALAVAARRSPRATQLAVLGATMLLGFVALRAALLQHFLDLSSTAESLLSWALEASALLTICAGARLRHRS